MPKAMMKTKIILIIILIILIGCGCFWLLKPKEEIEVHSIYLDLSIPLYQDSNVDENLQQAKLLVQAINNQLAEEKNLELIVQDDENLLQEKDLSADLTLSIQCLKADESKITSYLPISNDSKHDDSLKFANIVANNLSDLNYQGNYYYYLLPVGNDMYHELTSQEKIVDETAIGLPLLANCQKPIIMLNYYYQENNEEVMNTLASKLAEAVMTYFNEA